MAHNDEPGADAARRSEAPKSDGRQTERESQMTRKILRLLVPLAVGLAIGNWWGAGASDTDYPEHEQQTVIHRCPMHPTVVSEGPGSCPICSMDLVADEIERKTTSTGERQLGTVAIDATTIQNMGVRTAIVDRRSLVRSVRAVGRVDYDETRMSDVNTKVPGWVEKLHVDFTGQRVERGQPLLEIYSPELVNAQEEHLIALEYVQRLQRQRVAEDVLQGARDLVEASAQRLRFLDVTEERIARLEAGGTVSRTVTVESPQQGVVVHKAVFEGAYIRPGEHLYRIADLSHVWVIADLFERDLPWVQQGQGATVSLAHLPDQTLHGTVEHIFPFLDADTRSVRARLAFDNAARLLKPEMFADVLIDAPAVADVVAAPVQAILHTGARRLAIVHLGDGRFQPRAVEVGIEADGWYEIRSGLREGDEIVTSAQFLIDSESHLKTAVNNMRYRAQGDHASHLGG